MSKTKQQDETISPSRLRIIESRQHTKRVTEQFTSFDEAGLAFLKKASEHIAEGSKRFQILADRAANFLKQRGLPSDPVLYEDPTTGALISEAECDERAAKGQPHGITGLENYLKKIGYGILDDEMILARIISHADLILRPTTGYDTALERAYRIGREVSLFEELTSRDQQSRAPKPKRKTWAEQLAAWLVAKYPDFSAPKRWKQIPLGEGEAIEIWEYEIYRDRDVDGKERVFCRNPNESLAECTLLNEYLRPAARTETKK